MQAPSSGQEAVVVRPAEGDRGRQPGAGVELAKHRLWVQRALRRMCRTSLGGRKPTLVGAEPRYRAMVTTRSHSGSGVTSWSYVRCEPAGGLRRYRASSLSVPAFVGGERAHFDL